MKISADIAALKRTSGYEYAVRFLFGGSNTVIAAMLAKAFGSTVGGLFLAFPAIFPASITLVEKHERQKKEAKGLNGIERARLVAAVDAAGAAMGSIALVTFAAASSVLLGLVMTALALGAATLVWLIISAAVWRFRKLQASLRTAFASDQSTAKLKHYG
jgi:hypothetical protein